MCLGNGRLVEPRLLGQWRASVHILYVNSKPTVVITGLGYSGGGVEA